MSVTITIKNAKRVYLELPNNRGDDYDRDNLQMDFVETLTLEYVYESNIS